MASDFLMQRYIKTIAIFLSLISACCGLAASTETIDIASLAKELHDQFGVELGADGTGTIHGARLDRDDHVGEVLERLSN